MKVKIYGAGSIGNHLSHASRLLNWEVDVYDLDNKALDRMKNVIYPTRYGKWDESINLFNVNQSINKKYDYIFIGTPPDTHKEILLSVFNHEKPKAILVEKPLCSPDIKEIKAIEELLSSEIPIFVGYDHVVSNSIKKVSELIKSNVLGEILSLDVEFREHWKGIFLAHPWLEGPQDSYLGFWRRGGGASGEHSHALNLWQYLSSVCGSKKIVEVQAMLDYSNEKIVDYDRSCLLNLKTDTGLVGRVIQDVVTSPSKKNALIQGSKGKIEWLCHYKNNDDRIIVYDESSNFKTFDFKKNRPDDFVVELNHIHNVVKNGNKSPIELKYGLETMKILEKLHQN